MPGEDIGEVGIGRVTSLLSTMRCVAEEGLFEEKDTARYITSPLADFLETGDAELDEGYNGRRPKDLRSKNTAAWTGPGGG